MVSLFESEIANRALAFFVESLSGHLVIQHHFLDDLIKAFYANVVSTTQRGNVKLLFDTPVTVSLLLFAVGLLDWR